jgi:hypothetical protein
MTFSWSAFRHPDSYASGSADNLQAPSVYLDATLRRAFPLFRENRKLFETDCFNVTNHVQFGSASTNGRRVHRPNSRQQQFRRARGQATTPAPGSFQDASAFALTQCLPGNAMHERSIPFFLRCSRLSKPEIPFRRAIFIGAPGRN